jgi:hypothetical protein
MRRTRLSDTRIDHGNTTDIVRTIRKIDGHELNAGEDRITSATDLHARISWHAHVNVKTDDRRPLLQVDLKTNQL